MAMDPATAALILSGIGSALGGFFGGPDTPEGQNLGSFENMGELDPRSLLSSALFSINEMGGGLSNLLASPINIPGAAVQQPPSFFGGGMPMPIGLTGRDPALSDPSMLSLGGIGLGGNIFRGSGYRDFWRGQSVGGSPVPQGGLGGRPSGGGGSMFQPPPDSGQPRQPGDVLNQTSDAQQAAAAFDLLGVGQGDSLFRRR